MLSCLSSVIEQRGWYKPAPLSKETGLSDRSAARSSPGLTIPLKMKRRCVKKKVKNQPAGDSWVPLPIAINAFLLPPSQLFWGCRDCMKSRLVDEVTRARFQTLKVTQGQDSQCLRSSWSSYFLCFHFSFLKRAGSIFKNIFFWFHFTCCSTNPITLRV